VGAAQGAGRLLNTRVLVVGAGGQLGHDVMVITGAAGDDVLGLTRGDLDITDRRAVLEAATTWRPDIVVNCAAWTAVDACESDPERAQATNGLAVRWVAEACDGVGAHLIQLSTDYVFDGSLSRPYHEWDRPNPLGVYGSSKLAGEREALVLGAAATVVRTSWVCGVHGTNIVRTILGLLAGGDDTPGRLAFVDDQWGCPTFTADLAPMLRRLALERRGGVHHVTNQGAVSWFQFAQAVVAAAGRDPQVVRPIATAELDPPRPAPRPVNSVLDNAALRAAGIPALRDFHEPLIELVTALTA
jgi:dTDP-4-dehydrorhamnose reductase